MDAAAFELDGEEHVEAAQRERLDGEEVAGQHARGLLAQELPPARARAPRRRPQLACKQDAPDRARRDTQTQLQQLAGDPRVAPARVLAGEAQHELSHAAVERRTAGTPTRLRPLATHELPVPAQKRLWCDDQAVAPPGWQQTSECRKESTIGWTKHRASLLA